MEISDIRGNKLTSVAVKRALKDFNDLYAKEGYYISFYRSQNRSNYFFDLVLDVITHSGKLTQNFVIYTDYSWGLDVYDLTAGDFYYKAWEYWIKVLKKHIIF